MYSAVMRGGLRSWKRGAESRGIRNAISYAFDGTCDAHRSPTGVESARKYGSTDEATVTRFVAVAGALRPEIAAHGRDGQQLLVGDVVQTRRNDRGARVQNRATWVITAIRPERIELRNLTDTTERRHVSVEYASDHVHLADPSTVHGIQGDTADASVVGPGVDAAGLYVDLTRGRAWNQAVVVASPQDAALCDLAEAMRRGGPEPTFQDSRRAARLDLSRAARDATRSPADEAPSSSREAPHGAGPSR